MTKEKFIEITGVNPSMYKGESRVVTMPGYPDREYKVMHTAEALVERVSLDDPNLLQDGKLVTRRNSASYIWRFYGDTITCEMQYSTRAVKHLYVFVRKQQPLVVSQQLTLQNVSGQLRLFSGTSVNGKSVADTDTASEIVRIGGGIVFDSDLGAPVLTHSVAASIGDSFSNDWSEDASTYLPLEFGYPLTLTLETTIRDGELRRYYKSYVYDGEALTESNDTPAHHKAGTRLIVRSSDWQ